MNSSLQKRVTIFITLVIFIIGALSTYLFTSAFSRSKERGLVIRGTALCTSLSKAAEEGLAKEDLSLIKKASHVIQAPDVTLAQVYSNIWEPVDAYPVGSWKNPPRSEAVSHFKGGTAPFHIKMAGGYDFYSPIFFNAFEDSPPTIIGYVRVTLSSAAFQGEVKELAAVNIAVSVAIMLCAILSLNILIQRFVVKPIMALHQSISRFKSGAPTGLAVIPRGTTGEIRELALEFNRMCETVKENENKLIESDRRIRSLFDRVEHAIFRTDKDGEIVEANSKFRKMFGNVTGLCDIMIGDINAATCLRKAALEKALHIEDKAAAWNGDELVISLSLYPERNGGDVKGFDGYIIDITEKKRLEERLMRSQKLEAVGTLAAGMAHDFNNLLTAILGYSGILLKMVKEGDPFYKPTSVIHDAAKRGAELGRKILTVTRKEKMATKPVNINDIITHSMDLLQRSLPKDIEIIMKLKDALPVTNADPSQVQQVIINLAVNARDAMPDGGKLIIETSVVGPGNGLGDPAHAGDSGFIKLSVSDTGEGIDSGTQARIFDPFFTTKEVGKGTGLGLYIVHSIVNNHGGYINLYSEPQKGTRFNLYFPISKGGAAEEPQEAVDVRGAGTILVIDDEPDVRELCKDVLGPLGYTVLLAENPGAGINLYREKQNDIALVILDMVMPKMGGTEVFQALRTINRNVKILLYSGYGHTNFAGIDELLKRGANGFIQKPFSGQDIGIAIKNILSA